MNDDLEILPSLKTRIKTNREFKHMHFSFPVEIYYLLLKEIDKMEKKPYVSQYIVSIVSHYLKNKIKIDKEEL